MDKKHDAFCWVCTGRMTTLNCSKCIRSFHLECTKDENVLVIKNEANNWSCTVCSTLETCKNTPEQLKWIPLIIDRFWKPKYINLNKRKKRCGAPTKRVKIAENMEVHNDENENIFVCADVVNPIDLSKILEKANTYKSLEELFEDFKWIAHNLEVLWIVHNFPDHHEKKIKLAKKLLQLVSYEIESVKKRLQCHVNANRPHPIKLTLRKATSPENQTPQDHSEDENDSNDELPGENFSVKSEDVISIEDVDFDLPSTGRMESDDEDVSRENGDTVENMKPENELSENDLEDNPNANDPINVNVSDMNKSLQNFMKGFNQIYQENANLKSQLTNLETKHKVEVQILKDTNENLMAEIEQSKEDHKRIIEEQKQEYSQLIEESKKNHYCLGCGQAKFGRFYCDEECERRGMERPLN